MFEKEAEDYAMREVAPRQELYIKGRADIDSDYEKVKKIWQDGTEFGYNKANEWHYVKDGDLPKENQLVLLYRENPNGANVALTYWYKSYVKDKVIAWKEIVLPKENE